MVLLLSYDLKEPDDTEIDYAKLIKAIKSNYPENIHLHESVWIIDSGKESPKQVRENLDEHTPKNGRLFVIRVTSNWSASHISKTKSEWLKDPARTF